MIKSPRMSVSVKLISFGSYSSSSSARSRRSLAFRSSSSACWRSISSRARWISALAV